jgi:hypothetical protein
VLSTVLVPVAGCMAKDAQLMATSLVTVRMRPRIGTPWRQLKLTRRDVCQSDTGPAPFEGSRCGQLCQRDCCEPSQRIFIPLF